MAEDFRIHQKDCRALFWHRFGNGVQVGTGAVVIGRIWIGTNAVVTRDVPENAMVGGVPAREIRHPGRAKRKAAS